MRRSPTAYTFRHYRQAEDGQKYLIWASGEGEFALGEIVKGGKLDIDLIADQEFMPNNLVDEGEADMLSVYLRNGTAPTNFFLRLYADTPIDTDTLATLTGECVGTGYPGTNTIARSTIGWPTHAIDAGDWKTTSLLITWTAGNTWTASLTNSVLATVQTGTAGLFIAYRALGAARSLINTDTLDANIALKLA